MNEKMSFENQWNAAFEGAEVAPPAHVWKSVEGALAGKEAATYKNRFILFKWVAAASVSLALAFGVTLWYERNQNYPMVAESESTPSMVEEQNATRTEPKEEERFLASETEVTSDLKNITDDENVIVDEIVNEGEILEVSNNLNDDYDHTSKQNNALHENNNTSNAGLFALAEEDEDANGVAIVLASNEQEAEPEIFDATDLVVPDEKETWAFVPSKELEGSGIQEPDLADQLYGVANPYAVVDLKSTNSFDLWAGISFGTGTFNPGSASGVNESADVAFEQSSDNSFDEIITASAAPLQYDYSSGRSFSAGMNVGGKLNKKILLSSGLHYSSVMPSSSSNVTVVDNQSSETFALTNLANERVDLDAGLSAGDYRLVSGTSHFDNSLEYLIIPVKAGYVVLDRKFNIVLNTGMSANFLIRSGLTSSDGGPSTFSDETNDFRKTYFDLLTSVEMGYRLKENYYLSLEPNFRKALGDFTQNKNATAGKPTNFGISIGIKYNF